MEKNMASWDRVARIILGVLFLFLAYDKSGVWLVLGVLGTVFILTSAVGFCPLYKIVGLKTIKES